MALIPMAERIFNDFGMKLPDTTILFINLSSFTARYVWELVPAAFLFDIGILIAFYKVDWDRAAKIWGYLVLLGEMLFICSGFLAILIPLENILRNLSSGKA